MPVEPCKLDACRTCGPCYHGHHEACRHQVRCPVDSMVRPCRCCGFKEAAK
jgi:hypothetical protein